MTKVKAMRSTRWIAHQWIGLVLLAAVTQAEAGQTPGIGSPWNGPWGSGFLNGESYSPLANPYIGAGYPVAAPGPYGGAGPAGGYPMQASPQQMQAQPRYLPGGGYILPPGAGGGMMPGAYANH
jgi:hypothetical protein